MDHFSEDSRLRTLYSYKSLDGPPDDAFHDLARAAARVCRTAMAGVSLIDAERQQFQGSFGFTVRETPRSISFCDHAIAGRGVFVVCDAALDPRFCDNPLVLGTAEPPGPSVRFYAGAPFRAPDGQPLGALCVFDTLARPEGLTREQAELLTTLADQVEPRLRLRMELRDREALAQRQAAQALATLDRERRLVSALEAATVGWWDWDIATDRMQANADLARGLGLDAAAVAQGLPLAAFLARVHPHDRPHLEEAIAEAISSGKPLSEEYRTCRPDGRIAWISARGRCLYRADGAPVRLTGVANDVTARRLTETRLKEVDIARELALDAARLGRFDHDLVEGRRFYDARALAMLGLTLEEAQDSDLLLSRVHPDDRERVMAAQAAARDPERRGLYREVYRVRDSRSGLERWLSGVGRTRFEDGVCTRFIGVLEDVTEAKLAEAHRSLMMHELNHRVKNTLALVQGLVDASLRAASDPLTVRADITSRILALGRAHDLLTVQSWSAASTREVVEQAARGLSLPAERVHMDGPPVQLGPKPALQLALAMHELATNALKYGSLSNSAGEVTLTWGLQGPPGYERFQVEWVERGGPPVSPPARRGFGSRLIERATAAEFGGEVALTYEPDGLRWRLDAPYAGLAERGRGPPEIAAPLPPG